jgi:hypothetical protein
LTVNIVDYFDEKWNEIKSNGTNGEKKTFIYKSEKAKRMNQMKKIFEFTENGKDEIICKSFRETAPQKPEYSKRKLNEFLYVVEKINSKNLQFEIMKKTLYNSNLKNSFLNGYQNYFYQLKDKWKQNNVLNFFLTASCFGHFEILKWFIQLGYDVNTTNDFMKETGLHLGIFIIFMTHKLYFVKIKF